MRWQGWRERNRVGGREWNEHRVCLRAWRHRHLEIDLPDKSQELIWCGILRANTHSNNWWKWDSNSDPISHSAAASSHLNGKLSKTNKNDYPRSPSLLYRLLKRRQCETPSETTGKSPGPSTGSTVSWWGQSLGWAISPETHHLGMCQNKQVLRNWQGVDLKFYLHYFAWPHCP